MQNSHSQNPPYGPTTQTAQLSYQPVMQHPQVHFIGSPEVGDKPQQMQCPSCHATVMTKVNHEASSKTHLVALGLCLFVGTCCLCLLPYCGLTEFSMFWLILMIKFSGFNSCKTANHTCPQCGNFIGSHDGLKC